MRDFSVALHSRLRVLDRELESSIEGTDSGLSVEEALLQARLGTEMKDVHTLYPPFFVYRSSGIDKFIAHQEVGGMHGLFTHSALLRAKELVFELLHGHHAVLLKLKHLAERNVHR